MAAAGGGPPSLEDRVEELELQVKRITEGLQRSTSLLANAVKELKVPDEATWTPILNKIKQGKRINPGQYTTIENFLNYENYKVNQLLNNAITFSFRGMLIKHIGGRGNEDKIKEKTISVTDAMKYIKVISQKHNEQEVAQYLNSQEIFDYISS